MARETVETVMGEVFWSDDNWVTVWKLALGGQGGERKLTGKAADRVRYLAVIKYGGGRNDN